MTPELENTVQEDDGTSVNGDEVSGDDDDLTAFDSEKQEATGDEAVTEMVRMGPMEQLLQCLPQ